MGKCPELPLLSAWVTKGWGSRSVQRVLLQIGTLIIHNQTYQVNSAAEAAGSEKGDHESKGAHRLSPQSSRMGFLFSHCGLFCFHLTEREWKANTVEYHPIQPITCPLRVLHVSGTLLLKKVHSPWCRFVLVSLLSHLLECCGIALLSRALLLISHLLIQESHLEKTTREKLACEASVWSWKHFLFIIWNVFLIYSNFIQIQFYVDCCTCGSFVSMLLL